MCQKLEQHLYQTKLEEQAYDGFLKSIELTIGKKKRRGSCHARSKLRANASQRQRRKGKKKMNSRRKGVTESENKKSNEVITKLFGAL
ncbi:hypothetical protein AAZX31_14G068700 [Glycine max]